MRAEIESIEWKIDMDTLEHVAASTLDLNDIGYVRLITTSALFTDPYVDNRGTGSFILIDSATNNTVAAGMVGARKTRLELEDMLKEARAGSLLPPKTHVSPRERFDRLGQKGGTIWLTGLPGSGRWALAYALERRLFDEGRTATVIVPTGEDLDGIISAAKAATDAGLLAICAYPSYKAADRERVRERVGAERMFQVFVNTDPELCRERRPNADFGGFEAPRTPEVEVSLGEGRLLSAVDTVLEALHDAGQFERPQH